METFYSVSVIMFAIIAAAMFGLVGFVVVIILGFVGELYRKNRALQMLILDELKEIKYRTGK